MSAFIVDKRHIDALVQAGLKDRVHRLSWCHDGRRHTLELQNADDVGSMLWAENVASVEHRYSPPGREGIYGEAFGEYETGSSLPGAYQLETISPELEPIETPQWTSEYHFPVMRAPNLSPVEVLKAIDCYEYQSCEHPEWEESEAHAFCEALRHSMICDLPGYDTAPWGVR